MNAKSKIWILSGAVFLAACGNRSSSVKPEVRTTPVFTPPAVPQVLVGNTERTAYMASHYWQGLNYTDTAWLADSAALKQLFTEWIALLRQLPAGERAARVSEVISRGNDHPAMQLRLAELAEHYFHNPNSPYRNEELYIPVLRALIAAPQVEDIYKERPRYQLEKALMNRPGIRAADFAFVTQERRRQHLADIGDDYILLYFFNPACHDCKCVAAYITGSPVLGSLSEKGSLIVLAVYLDKDLQAWERYASGMPEQWIVARYADERARQAYDLPAIPNLYLLDKEKSRVERRCRGANRILAGVRSRENG